MPNDRITYGVYTWNFIAIHGAPDLPDWTLKPIKKDGVDGIAFKYQDRMAEPSTLTLEAAAEDLLDEAAWMASMKALVGYGITIYSATGITYSNVVVLGVRLVNSQAVTVGAWGATSLGSDGRILTFEMTVQYPYGTA